MSETPVTSPVPAEVQGIPVLLAPRTGEQVGAGLVFRVGRADETLATSGITHLVEHLALHRHGLSDLHYNGMTADTFTHFHVEGTTQHVVEYLNGVCAALRDLPVERLEIEREILRTEAAGRSGGPAPNLALYRYGAQGFGLSSYDEFGLAHLDADAVRRWSAENFTVGNAVLWITADEVPEGLDLGLPDGRRRPLPAVTSALPQTPAWFGHGGNAVVMQGIVERSTAASLFARVLAKALFQDLRQTGGYSYTATADYWPRDAGHASIVALADSAPDKREAVIGGMVDTLARLRLGTIEQSELTAAQDAALAGFTQPDLAAAMLPARAVNLLIGYDDLGIDELQAEVRATTVGDLRRVAEQVHETMLAQVPALGLDWAGFAQAPQWSVSAVVGREFTSVDPDAGRLVVGKDGVSIVHEGGASTVLFRDAVAMEKYADGGRRLYGPDGFSVPVEPTLHAVDEAAVARVDQSVPATVVVPRPARDPERLPRPHEQPAAATGAARGGPWTLGRFARQVWGAVVYAITAILLLTAVTATVDLVQDDPEMDAGTAVVLWIMAAIGVTASVRHARR